VARDSIKVFPGAIVTSAALFVRRNDPNTIPLHLQIHIIPPIFENGTAVIYIVVSEEHNVVSSKVLQGV
jgi:hypothetical protein